jgi:hypothetical protein
LKAFEFIDYAQATWRSNCAGYFVLPTLIMGGRAEAPWRRALKFDALKVPIKGKVEVEARLFAIGDDVKAGCHLVVDGSDNGVFLEFSAVGLAELIEVSAGKFEPTGKRVAADYCRSKRMGNHGIFRDIIAEVKDIRDKCQ